MNFTEWATARGVEPTSREHGAYREVWDAAEAETVRKVLALFEPDACDLYHNESNNYGAIDLKLFVAGNPERFRGAETTAEYEGGNVRGTGRYKLNDALVAAVVKMIGERS